MKKGTQNTDQIVIASLANLKKEVGRVCSKGPELGPLTSLVLLIIAMFVAFVFWKNTSPTEILEVIGITGLMFGFIFVTIVLFPVGIYKLTRSKITAEGFWIFDSLVVLGVLWIIYFTIYSFLNPVLVVFLGITSNEAQIACSVMPIFSLSLIFLLRYLSDNKNRDFAEISNGLLGLLIGVFAFGFIHMGMGGWTSLACSDTWWQPISALFFAALDSIFVNPRKS